MGLWEVIGVGGCISRGSSCGEGSAPACCKTVPRTHIPREKGKASSVPTLRQKKEVYINIYTKKSSVGTMFCLSQGGGKSDSRKTD